MSDSDVVIRVEGLGKKYSLHHAQGERYTAQRDVVARQAQPPIYRATCPSLSGSG